MATMAKISQPACAPSRSQPFFRPSGQPISNMPCDDKIQPSHALPPSPHQRGASLTAACQPVLMKGLHASCKIARASIGMAQDRGTAMNERELRGLIDQREDRQAVPAWLRPADDGGGADGADGDAAPGLFRRGDGADASRPTSRPSAAAAARSRCCGGRAPTLLNPHFAVGTKDQDGSRFFYEPLAGWDADGNLKPVLAESIPGREDGTLAADGKSVTWKLKKGVKWHDGKPFTADDVVFNWEYAKDPATAATTSRHLQGRQGREGRRLHGQGAVRQADAVLGARLRRHAGHDHSQAPVRRLHGRQVARGADQPQAGRHRPLHVQGLQAGRHGGGRDQPELPHGQPALFRQLSR